MLRSALLWASTNPTLATKLPRYGFVRRATKRFMPGEGRDDALSEAAKLAEDRIATTITLLGENLASLDEADGVVAHYREALTDIEGRALDTEISVKPTQLGLDYGVDEAARRLEVITRSTDSLVWVDMEGSAYVDDTLEIVRRVRRAHRNVGVCVQAYLHRTRDDLAELLEDQTPVRLVKGAYNEPPRIAFAKKSDVDRNFVELTKMMLRARAQGCEGRPVIASHDPRMLAETRRLADELGLAKGRFEFAMLFGISRPEQRRLARQGHAVRVLISYGSAWFPWYMRRLAERPANLWFVAKQMVSR